MKEVIVMQSSPAVQIMITVIPIFGIAVGGFVICMHLFLYHRQRMAMLEKNMNINITIDMELLSLFTGLVLTCVGIALTIFFTIKSGIDYSLLSGLIPLATGIALLAYYMIYSERNHKNGK